MRKNQLFCLRKFDESVILGGAVGDVLPQLKIINVEKINNITSPHSSDQNSGKECLGPIRTRPSTYTPWV